MISSGTSRFPIFQTPFRPFTHQVCSYCSTKALQAITLHTTAFPLCFSGGSSSSGFENPVD